MLYRLSAGELVPLQAEHDYTHTLSPRIEVHEYVQAGARFATANNHA